MSAAPELTTYESMRKLSRHLERSTGRIVVATIAERGGQWTLSFTVDVPRQAPASIVVGTFIVFLLKSLCQNGIVRLTR